MAHVAEAGLAQQVLNTGIAQLGDMSHDQNLASMRRFGEEVMPAFRT